MYAYNRTPHEDAIRELMATSPFDPSAPIWRITPFIDAPGTGGSYYFEWEREWRHVGHLRFAPAEVAFLLIPESLHGAARAFFADVASRNLGPAYFCPFLDPLWDLGRVRSVLTAVT